ncbi:MAG: CbtB-domain containing protein [Deltaproteobacteria bacterium]|nr:CbtB-domain containing protein [Deltaproteobacteria bacterium]
MERMLDRDVLVNTLIPAALVVAMAFTIVTIAFGFEGVARGVHDAFHDFRHVIGMPCH